MDCPIRNSSLTVMSNEDYKKDPQTVAHLIDHPDEWAAYPAYNFVGRVWFLDPGWACQVWVLNEPQETITAGSLRELMKAVSSKYGWD